MSEGLAEELGTTMARGRQTGHVNDPPSRPASGYGAMQVHGQARRPPPPTGPQRSVSCGWPVAAGVDHIDTAQYYGAVNGLIREAC